ncbi:hypothetical protein GF319_03885 [Candidatus Bathyarchaeota archaeon]|jgi:hypothetical protein|nr:hypothetical protein [Candidatus Bathyarchaeota archaeon]
MSLQSPHEFYNVYRDDPAEAKREAYRIGQRMGLAIMEEEDIEGQGLKDLSEIIECAMRQIYGEHNTIVEDGRVIISNSGFCAIMRAALTHNFSWRWIDEHLAWPCLEGLASIVRCDYELRIPSARCRGDKECIHVFELKKDK